MSSTAFLSLEDISYNLLRYDESVISVDMDETLQKAYEQLEEEIRAAMKEHRGNKSLMSILLNTLLLYPDHPYDFDYRRKKTTLRPTSTEANVQLSLFD